MIISFSHIQLTYRHLRGAQQLFSTRLLYHNLLYQGENGFQYYEYADVSNPSVFEEYVEQVTGAALYNTGIRAEYGGQLITLTTCSYHTENRRFVVVGRQIRP